MTITLLWYHIPVLLSVLALCAAIWWPINSSFPELDRLIRLCVAMAFIGFVWIVTAVMK